MISKNQCRNANISRNKINEEIESESHQNEIDKPNKKSRKKTARQFSDI